MKKYIGKYRVDIERDSITGEPVENGEMYLRCKGGVEKVYRYDDNTLVVYISSSIEKANNIVKKMSEIGVNIVFRRDYHKEADIHIKECDLDKVSEIIGIITSGAKIHPISIKNHPRRDEIRQEKRDNMSEDEKEQLRLKGEMLKSFRKNKDN